ncbi:MAG: nucleotidyltransferase [Ignavibacteria bacterium GWB2_35_12]|nr:MAG: nucleotidyltransferase [Ignavibacteria bacterium GWA2_35_8]OGU40301.1 MAG: nucleotidyltransferase [Ignavibacteria bacterium GWB2_35_12]OGU93037.1 MAG: nucleotidyltransferase [Ignavibacteria bacterium RIFOXYA2_FULL_35_10]OGV24729.1 MAG: nucleotidyltransferase [Ignavibacteria bacterium RIFOXYC2_FULL_35_21]
MNKIVKNRLEEIRKLCREYDVKSLYVFGSGASGNFKDKSDIDLLVSFKKIPIKKYTDNYFSLHYLFQKLFNREIDLITENSLSNPYFIESIEKTKLLLYESGNKKISD